MLVHNVNQGDDKFEEFDPTEVMLETLMILTEQIMSVLVKKNFLKQ